MSPVSINLRDRLWLPGQRRELQLRWTANTTTPSARIWLSWQEGKVPVHSQRAQMPATGKPHQLWLTDMSEHWAGDSKLYLCAVKDVFSNRIVGYSIDRHMTSQLAVDALTMAVAHRGGRSNVGQRERGGP